MIRGTTPTFTLTLDDDQIDLTQVSNVYATFRQGKTTMTKSGSDITVTAHAVDVYLSQSESLTFAPGIIEVQLNWTYAQGERASSNICHIRITDNLIGSVLA